MIPYYDYCFISNYDTKKLKEKYPNDVVKIVKGYKFYEDEKPCSKIYFKSTSVMKRLLTSENIKRANNVRMKPDRKLLLDKDITYKFIVPDHIGPLDSNKIFPINTDEIDLTKVIYCDIEVDTEKDTKFPSGDNAIHPVISIAYECPNRDLWWTCLDKSIKKEKQEFIWTIKSNKIYPEGKKVNVIMYKNENDLIKFFGEIQKTYNSYIITGWNFTRFDAYYLIGRCKKLNLNPSILTPTDYLFYRKKRDKAGFEKIEIRTNKCYILDMMEAFIKYYPERLRYNSLDNVASVILGEGYGKLKLKKSISETYKTNKKELMFYNVIDTILVRLINEKIKVFQFYELRRKKRGLNISEVFGTIKPIEASLDFFAEKHKVALPDLIISTDDETVQGADVYTESPAIFDYSMMFDYKSEYPSIAASLNCSRTTLVENINIQKILTKAFNNYKKTNFKKKPEILNKYTVAPGQGELIFFNNEKDCFEKKFLMSKMKEREKYFNTKMQYDFDSLEYMIYDIYERDVKLDGNGLYGAWTNKIFKLSKKKCGIAITSVGRRLLEFQRKYVLSLGHKVAISDTDSSDFAIEDSNMTKEEAVKYGYQIEKLLSDTTNIFVQKKFLFGSKNGYLENFNPDEENIDTHWIFSKFEKLFNPMITTGKKKHYAYKEIWKDGKFLKKPKYVIKGFPCIKRDSSLALKKCQTKLIVNLLDNGYSFKSKIIPFMKSHKKKLKTNNIDYLCTTAVFNAKITSYKAIEKGYLPPIHIQGLCNSIANYNIQFEPLSRYKLLKIKKIKNKKNSKKTIKIDGLEVKFKDTIVAYNKISDLPTDFFEYFQPDYDFIFNKVLINKCKVFLDMLNVNPIVFTNQKQIVDF